MITDYDSPDILKAIAELDSGNYIAALNQLIPLAESGNPRAQCNLANLYHCGLGAEVDGTKAVELYTRVAEQNIRQGALSAVAYNNLATIYFVGLPGIERDPEKSISKAS